MLRIILVVSVLCAGVGAPAAAQAAPAPKGFFGVMINGPLDDPSVDLDAQATLMRSSGVESWRVEFSWDLIEPTEGSFDWTLADRKVLAAARSGSAVLGLALRSPAWANGGSADPFVPPEPARFAGFLRALIERYGPGGVLWQQHPDVRPNPVRSWELWNEPNIPQYFRSQPYAAPYAALVRAAYPAVKAADSGATVVLASMTNFSWRDLAKLLDAPGPRLQFDAAGTHPYSGAPANVLKIVRLNRQVLNRRGYRDTPLWLTEITWSSAKGKKVPLTKNWETSEAGQARRLTRMYGLLRRYRKPLKVERVFWYTWATIDRDSNNSFDYSGLNQWLPDGTFRAKPALAAFRRAAKNN